MAHYLNFQILLGRSQRTMSMKVFKKIWRVLRVILFCIVFLICGVSILPLIFCLQAGIIWPFGILIVVFILGFVIQELERRAGWVDEWYRWKKDE